MSRLMGLDYVIQYWRGQENKAVDALSRCVEERASVAIIAITSDWFREVTTSYTKGEWIKELMEQMILNPDSKPGYSLRNELLRYKDIIIIGEDETLRQKILEALHDSPVGGYSGIQNSYSKIKQLFF